jgi:N-acyl homoserine lactone hydrolase
MKSADFSLLAPLLLAATVTPALAQPPNSGVDRLYVLECCHGTAPDQGRFSPRYNDGKPFDLVDNCYLIHAQGYLLWGTGVADKFFQRPDGLSSLGGRPNRMRSNTLASQLEQLDIKPSDIRFIGLTNSHIDHIGNLEMFPKVMVLMQKSEWKFPETHRYEGTPEEAPFKPNHPVTKVDGDYDVFGEGSVQLIATSSVTPGNQSLLVKLPETGAIVLSGDVIHFQYGWDNGIVPTSVWDRPKTLDSFKRLADVLARSNAQLWIEHDKGQGDARRVSPDYYQ